MKTITAILVLYLLINPGLFSQGKISNIPIEKLPLKPLHLSEQQQIDKVVQFIIQYYGKSFKFLEQLRTGNYVVEKNAKNKSQLILKIYIGNDKTGKFETIRLNPILIQDGYTELMFDRNDVENYVNTIELGNISKRNTLSAPTTIVDKNKILFDQMILKNSQIPQEYWYVLNRTMAEFFDNQYGETARLFKMAQDAVAIPLGLSGSESKILAVDNQFSSVIYFDSDARISKEGAFNKVYGQHGLGFGEFMNPTGITSGESYEGLGYYFYPIYIADMYNFRIDKVIYQVPQNSETSGSINPDSFTSIDNVLYPYSIAFIKDSAGISNKLWVSEAHPTTPFISCYDAGN